MNDPTLTGPLLVAAVLILIGGGLALAVYLSRKAEREALRKLGARFQGKLSWVTGTLNAKYQGFDFSVALVPPGKNTPRRLVVHLSRKFPFNLRIYRENFFSGLGKGLGLVREVKIDDPSFDSQFLIFSNRPVMAVNFLSMGTKELLRQLFAEGFRSFLLDHSGMTVQKPDYDLANDLSPERTEELLRRLLSLSGGVA